MKTLQQLKEDIKVGTVIKITAFIDHNAGPIKVPEKIAGQRTVTKVDTTGFYLSHNPEKEKGSFCQWPKASNLKYSDNTFTITDVGFNTRTYKII